MKEYVTWLRLDTAQVEGQALSYRGVYAHDGQGKLVRRATSPSF